VLRAAGAYVGQVAVFYTDETTAKPACASRGTQIAESADNGNVGSQIGQRASQQPRVARHHRAAGEAELHGGNTIGLELGSQLVTPAHEDDAGSGTLPVELAS
jgi:hypothetical protein